MAKSSVLIRKLMNRDSFISAEIKLRRYEFRCYLSALRNINNSGGKKFALLAQWRTGSTLLEQLLNCHPDIKCDTEIYNKFSGFGASPRRIILSPKLMLNGRRSMFSSKVYGFNLKLFQVKNFLPFGLYSPDRFIKDLSKKGWKIVYLRRMNILEQALSFIIATKRDYWHSWQKKNPDKSKMFIDFEDLLFHLELNEKITSEEQEMLKDIPHLQVNYEKNLLKQEEHQNTCKMIFDYLGLENKPVKAKLNKILEVNKYQELIQNYDELKKLVSKTRYANYI